MKFKTGDVVQLNSGSCAMTVSGVRSDGSVSLVWTDVNDVLQNMDVYPECLFFAVEQA